MRCKVRADTSGAGRASGTNSAHSKTVGDGMSSMERLGSPRNCIACTNGAIFPPLDQRGQKIDRPTSALSPAKKKQMEVWTPQKADKAKEVLQNNAARLTTKKKRTQPSTATLQGTRNDRLSSSPSSGRKTRLTNMRPTPILLAKAARFEKTDCAGNETSYLTPVKVRSKSTVVIPVSPIHTPAQHKFEYPSVPSNVTVFTPSKYDEFYPLCRARTSPDNFDCLCGVCALKNEQEREAIVQKLREEEAMRMKSEEEQRRLAELERERKRKQEERAKQNELQKKLTMLRKRSIYQRCSCFVQNDTRWNLTDPQNHSKGCPVRNLAPHTCS